MAAVVVVGQPREAEVAVAELLRAAGAVVEAVRCAQPGAAEPLRVAEALSAQQKAAAWMALRPAAKPARPRAAVVGRLQPAAKMVLWWSATAAVKSPADGDQ